MPSRLSASLLLAASVTALAACGQKDGSGADTSAAAASAGGINAPAVGAGDGINGRGITDSNAARPAATGGTGAPNNSGLATAPATGPGTGTGAAGERGTPSGAAGAGAPAVGPVPRAGVPGTDTARRKQR